MSYKKTSKTALVLIVLNTNHRMNTYEKLIRMSKIPNNVFT